MINTTIPKTGFAASLNEETGVKLLLLYFKLRDTLHLSRHGLRSTDNERMNDTIQTITDKNRSHRS